MFFGISLVVAAGLLLWPAGRSSQAAGSPHVLPADRLLRSNAPQPAVEIAASIPSPSPTVPPSLTRTPLPVPDAGLVWGRNANGVYLWESPKSKILAHLPNGTKVRILEERSSYGNLPWIKVEAPCGEGWILQTQVFREVDSPAAYIAIQDGTYLRDQPRGRIQQTLSMGTPLMRILEKQETEGRPWVRVEVVDGAVGWVVEEWLSAEMPLPDSHE